VGQYQYDALSRRIQKIANPASPPSPTTTRYFYNDKRIIEEQNGTGMTQATYVYGNYIDEVLTMNRLGTNYYYHQNALWSVEAVTNSAGAPVERYRYDAYGFVTVADGSFNPIAQNAWGTPHSAIGNPYLFTGRQLDEETGLYFYRARYYDPGKGRFLQRDPREYKDGMNLYEYVYSRPVNLLDPQGLCWCNCTPTSLQGVSCWPVGSLTTTTCGRGPFRCCDDWYDTPGSCRIVLCNKTKHWNCAEHVDYTYEEDYSTGEVIAIPHKYWTWNPGGEEDSCPGYF
jgi:RHS repeat-associated protein